jgi:hypothetical protein
MHPATSLRLLAAWTDPEVHYTYNIFDCLLKFVAPITLEIYQRQTFPYSQTKLPCTTNSNSVSVAAWLIGRVINVT